MIRLIPFFLIFLFCSAKAENMKVCYENFMPSAGMKDDKPIGIDVEILTEAMKTQNVKINFTMQPWNRCLFELDKKTVDAVIPMVYSKERDEKYSLGTSMRTRGNVLIANKKMKEINSLKDLTGLKVAYAAGYVISKDFTDANYFTKVEVTSSDEVAHKVLEKIIDGTADCGFLDIETADHVIKKLKLKNKVIITNFKIKKETHVGFTKNNPYLTSYEKGFKIISKNGKVTQIINKYLSK